jgi:NADPH:quinone reductase-like Zn-dependent oxidoreductase
VFGDGSVAGTTVLVQGVLGGVSSLAAQLAAWRGATVIGTVRRGSDLSHVDDAVAHRVALDEGDPVSAIRRVAPDGVHRIIEVSFSDNADLDAAVAAPEAVIAAYATRDPRPTASTRVRGTASSCRSGPEPTLQEPRFRPAASACGPWSGARRSRRTAAG